jgi:hypothetical protein
MICDWCNKPGKTAACGCVGCDCDVHILCLCAECVPIVQVPENAGCSCCDRGDE